MNSTASNLTSQGFSFDIMNKYEPVEQCQINFGEFCYIDAYLNAMINIYKNKIPNYMMISYQKWTLKRKGNNKKIQDNGDLKGKGNKEKTNTAPSNAHMQQMPPNKVPQTNHKLIVLMPRKQKEEELRSLLFNMLCPHSLEVNVLVTRTFHNDDLM